MNFELPNANVFNFYVGNVFNHLYLGAEVYGTARSGDEVVVTVKDGTVTCVIDSVQIGPMGQFLGQGAQNSANIGRGSDVRNIVDELEKRYPASKPANAKALDPRTVYTAAFLKVVAQNPTMPASPTMTGTTTTAAAA